MTIRTLCEVCKKVVRYTSDRQQEEEAIKTPAQFCEGHIAKPSKDALKIIMRELRAHANPDNAYFINKQSGELMSHAYINRKDGSYFPSIPKGSYELNAGRKQARSYAILEGHLNEGWLSAARDEFQMGA